MAETASMDPQFVSATKGPRITSITIAFSVLSAVVLASRLFTRFVIIRSVGAEDILILLAWISAFIFGGFILGEVKYGAGRHIATLAPAELISQLKMLYFSILFYRGAITCVQCSIVLQYIRIFPAHLWVRRICWLWLALIGLYNVSTLIAATFTCWPIRAFWDVTITNARCIDRTSLWFCNAIYSIVIDAGLIIIPLPALKSLSLPRRQKIALMLVFVIGSFACITSILRLHSLYVLTQSKDVTWDNADAAIWSSVEANVCVICACLPPLKPLVTRFFPKLMSATAIGTGTRSMTLRTQQTTIVNTQNGFEDMMLIDRKPTTTNVYSRSDDLEKQVNGNGRPHSADADSGLEQDESRITVTQEFTVT